MNVLIGDEDSATRYMISRALSHKFGADVEEAANGLDAIDKLQQRPFGALVMDARMPVMGGLETLQVLRASSQFARLPVIILTAERDERLIKEIVNLGVQDLILKPINADRFAERFERMLNTRDTHAQDASTGPVAVTGAPLAYGATALIADGDARYREYFRKVAGSRFAMTEAASGARALEACLLCPPDAVFLGTNLGVIGYEHIVPRLRAMKHGHIRLFAVPAKSEAEAVRATGLFDGVIARTYVPALFERELTRLGQPQTAFIRLRDQVPDIHSHVVSAAEQVCGTLFMADVEPQAASPFGDGPRAVASATLTGDDFTATVRTRIEMRVAGEAAAAFLGTAQTPPGEGDVLSVVGELTHALVDRVAESLRERKLECEAGPSEVGTEDGRAPIDPVPDDCGEDIHFRAADRPIHFQVTVVVAPRPRPADVAADEYGDAALLGAEA